MKLKLLTIKNVGPYTSTTLDLSAPVHVIMGPNEAGKSTILNAIRRVCGLKLDNLRKGDDKHLVRRGARSASIALSFEKGDEEVLLKWSPSGSMKQSEILAAHEHNEHVLHACLQPIRWLSLSPDDRRLVIGAAAGGLVTTEAIREAGIDNPEIVARIVERGLSAGKKLCDEKRREAQRDVQRAQAIPPPEDIEFEFPGGFIKASDYTPEKVDQGLTKAHRIERGLREKLQSTPDPDHHKRLEAKAAKLREVISTNPLHDLQGQLESHQDGVTIAEKTYDTDLTALNQAQAELSTWRARLQGYERQSKALATPDGVLRCDGRFSGHEDDVCPRSTDGVCQKLDEAVKGAQVAIAAATEKRHKAEAKVEETRSGVRSMQGHVERYRQTIARVNAAAESLEEVEKELVALRRPSSEDTEETKATHASVLAKIEKLGQLREGVVRYEERARAYSRAQEQIATYEAAVETYAAYGEKVEELKAKLTGDPVAEFVDMVKEIAGVLLPGHQINIDRNLVLDVDGSNWSGPILSMAAQTALDICCRMALCRISGVRLFLVDDLNAFDEKRRAEVLSGLIRCREWFDRVLIAVATRKGKKIPIDYIQTWLLSGPGEIEAA